MSQLTGKVEDAAGNALFASLVSQAILEFLVVSALAKNADMVNLCVHVREQAKLLTGPEGKQATELARGLEAHFRKRTAN